MKQVKSTAISVFALVLAFMWLAPLVWLVGTAFSSLPVGVEFAERRCLLLKKISG